MPEVFVEQRVAADHLQVVAVVARLADQQRRLALVAAVEQHVDAGRLEFCDRVQVVGPARRDLVVERLRDAAPVQLRLGHLGQALAKGLTVVQDGDPAVRPMLGQVRGGHLGLQSVAAHHAKGLCEPLIGDHRVGGRDRDHRHPGVRVHFGSGDDFVSLATIRVEPCPDCDGKCGIECVVLQITGHPDADRDFEVVWDREEAKRIAAAILRAVRVIPAPSFN